MEQLNRVELRGVIGAVKECGNTPKGKLYRVSLATNLGYKADDGSAVIETTWHNVSIYESVIKDNSVMEKGKCIHVIGRIRNTRYADSSGESRCAVDILANECVSINEVLSTEIK